MLALSLAAQATLSATDTPTLERAVTAALHTALAPALSAPTAPPVRLLAASLIDRRLTLNLSREALDLQPGSLAFEALTTRLRHAAGDVLRDSLDTYEIHTAIDGVPLHHLLATDTPSAPHLATPSTARQLSPLSPDFPHTPPLQALAGRRIAVSPGHGYYLNGANYVLQRSFFSGIVEDFVNHDIITHLHELLAATGADVRPTRNLDRTAGPGETGFPRWQEAARYHVKALGADSSVWNESGFTHLEQDIRCRPRYANSVAAELLVSVHNNGGGGTGTETLYDTNNGFGPESKRLADLVHAKVIAAIRRDYNPTWADRRVQGFNGSYGENRLATRPAILVEIAFMDRPTPDNAALQDDRFKRLVAAAIRDGIAEFLEGPVPATPTGLLATADATGVALTWVDAASNETGYRVERKLADASAWTALATTAANATAYRDTTAAPATPYVYRVHAFNAAGDSPLPTNEASVTLVPAPVTLVLASITPTTVQTRDWEQDVVFTVNVTDTSGQPALGASLLVRDGLRQTTTTLTSLTADATGQLTFRSTVPSGQANATYDFTFQALRAGATSSATVTRQAQVNHAATSPAAPTLLAQPAPQTVTAGDPATFSATATGSTPLSYQWSFNGTALSSASAATLTLPATAAAQAGTYAVTVSNNQGSVTSLAAPLTVLPAAWLSNVSLRTTLATGQNVIVGFVVSGGPKDILIRAAGPALAAFGLTTAMADPRLELYRDATRLTGNNDWPAALAPTIAALGAFPFSPASRDAALLRAVSGPHTVQATGTAGGVVLIEGYDAGPGSSPRLINLSARNRVGTGADILIAGFFVAGRGTQRVLIRAVGPTLTALGVPGVLANPQLEVTDSAGARLAANDNWDAALAPVFAQVGAFPLPVGSADAALVATLTAGRSYTVQVSGVAASVGEALVEVYELP